MSTERRKQPLHVPLFDRRCFLGAFQRPRWLFLPFQLATVVVLLIYFNNTQECIASPISLLSKTGGKDLSRLLQSSMPQDRSALRHMHDLRAGATLSSASAAAFEPLSYYLRVALAGGVAGATGSFVLYPLDSAKTLRQSDPNMYTSVLEALVKMMRSKNRLSRIYQGILPAALGAIPSSALYFGAYESSKVTLERLLLKDNDKGNDKSSLQRRLLVHGLAAASGNILSSTVFVPKEVIKQQLQYQAQSSTVNQASSIWSIVKEKGVSSLYAGYGATLMRNIPSAMLRFVLYEELKRKLSNNNNAGLQANLGSFLAGAVAGSTASFVMTPLDVVKSRLAVGTCPVGVKNCIVHVVRTAGYKGLYAGAGSRMLWSGAFSAIGFGTFEVVKGYLGVASTQPTTTGTSRTSTKSDKKADK